MKKIIPFVMIAGFFILLLCMIVRSIRIDQQKRSPFIKKQVYYFQDPEDENTKTLTPEKREYFESLLNQ